MKLVAVALVAAMSLPTCGAEPELPLAACGAEARQADVDGDGAEDRIEHVYSDEGVAVLRACLAGGKVSQLPGLGSAEYLELVDVDGDGRVEILYGASSVSATTVRIAAWTRGGLEPVVGSDGAELELVRGGTGDFDQHAGAWSQVNGWGCRDGAGELVDVVGVRTADGYEITETRYRIAGARAEVVATDVATAPADGIYPDVEVALDEC